MATEENGLSDQWKRGGICALCRRRDYCKTRCRAYRVYAPLRLKEYIQRRLISDTKECGKG